MEELKKCPFCGSEAELVTSEETFYYLVGKHGSACVSIDCTNRHGCGASMYCHYPSKHYQTVLAHAVKQWNGRVADVE